MGWRNPRGFFRPGTGVRGCFYLAVVIVASDEREEDIWTDDRITYRQQSLSIGREVDGTGGTSNREQNVKLISPGVGMGDGLTLGNRTITKIPGITNNACSCGNCTCKTYRASR